MNYPESNEDALLSTVTRLMSPVSLALQHFIEQHHLIVVSWVVVLAGAVLVGVTVWRLGRFIVTQFFRKPHDLAKRYGRGSWVVVSGSSGGIGLGFAVEFAKQGFNLVLISRNQERLDTAAAEVLAAATPADRATLQVKTIVADFSQCHHEQFWDDIMRPLDGLDISVLVNNVGMNHTESFATIPERVLLDMVQVNCTSQLIFTRRLIRRLLERTGWRDALTDVTLSTEEQRMREAVRSGSSAPAGVRSAVISVSSVAGQRPLLYLSPYSATKAFNDFFSRALSLEFGEHLDVISLRPGYVASNMSKLKETGGFVLDRYECARGCLDKVGYVTETYGDPRHAVYARSFFLLPESLLATRRRKRLQEKNELVAEERRTTENAPPR